MNFMIRIVAIITSMFLLAGSSAAAERILDFHSDITVRDDGSMRVVETIKVRAEGRDIKRGIYRDFPTKYQDRHGHRIHVKFDLIDVSRDGKREPFHMESMSNGVRIYVGHKNRFLRVPYTYTYRLVYETDRQLGFFEDHDELYWNVTGNGWKFIIERASAAIHLPAMLDGADLRLEGHTGAQGATGKAFRSTVDANDTARFVTTQALPAKNGLTIVVMWPKGHIHEPTTAQKFGFLLSDNVDVLVGVIGLAFLFTYYWYSWHRVGRDPEPGTIYPRYEPPAGFSPASARFIYRMGYDNKAFATALVNLGVKGQITIDENEDDVSLSLNEAKQTKMAPGESVILKDLFAHGDQIVLEQKNHKRIGAALKAHKASLAGDYERIYFNKNRKYVYIGIGVSALLILGMFLSNLGEQAAVSMFMTVWLTGWSFGVGVLGLRVVRAFRGMRGTASTIGAVSALVFAIPFFVGELVGLGVLFNYSSLGAIVILVVVVATNIGFFHWMKAPTRAGRQLLDEIEGFKMYLGIAEKERLRQMQSPERTPELFERYLPFALALDVEQAWAEKFSAVLAEAQLRRDGGYRPSWYRGRSWDVGRIDRFTAGLGGSLATTIASSATAPGSSSGSGGGGSSGGGGGGGGGGGW